MAFLEENKRQLCSGMKLFLSMLLLTLITVFWKGTAVQAAEIAMPDTADGRKVVLTDFQVTKVPEIATKYYSFEHIQAFGLDFFNDEIRLNGTKISICYTVDGKPYQVQRELYACVMGEGSFFSFDDGIEDVNYWQCWDSGKVKYGWKRYKTYKENGETMYEALTDNNAIVLSFCGLTAEIPVEMNVETPVKSITFDNEPWKGGVYLFQLTYDVGRMCDETGKALKVRINYKDGTSSVVVWDQKNTENYRKINGYSLEAVIENDDGAPGVDFKKFAICINYMGVTGRQNVSLRKDPVKKIKILKAPKKTFYTFKKTEKPDLYGAQIKIWFRDGKSQVVNIKTHKQSLKIKNKYNQNMSFDLYDYANINVRYMGVEAKYAGRIKVSKLGKASKIKSKITNVHCTVKKTDKLLCYTAKKNAKFKVSASGIRERYKAIVKKGKKFPKKTRVETEMRLIVMDEKGRVLFNQDGENMFLGDIGNIKMKKGKKYYLYLKTVPDLYTELVENDYKGFKLEVVAEADFKVKVDG